MAARGEALPEVKPGTQRYICTYVKIGDQPSDLGVKDGMPTDWEIVEIAADGKQTHGTDGGSIGSMAYKRVLQPYTPAALANVKAACFPVYGDPGPDGEPVILHPRAETWSLDSLAKEESPARCADLLAEWRCASKAILPLVLSKELPANCKMSSAAVPKKAVAVPDKNAITSGLALIGTGVGAHYSLYGLAFPDIGSLTGNLSFSGAWPETLSDAGSASTTPIALNGYSFNLSSVPGHYVRCTAQAFRIIGAVGPGAVTISDMYGQRDTVVGTASETFSFFTLTGATTDYTATIRNIVFNGQGKQCSAIRLT
jgi:hypothetical protein